MRQPGQLPLFVFVALGAATCMTYAVQEAAPSKPAETTPADSKPDGPQPKGESANPGQEADPNATPLQRLTAGCALPEEELYQFDVIIPGMSYEEVMKSDLGAHPWQRVRQFHRLQQEIEKRVKLSPEQKKLVQEHFEQLYAQMLKYPERSAWNFYNYLPHSEENLKKMEEELAAARAAGDSARGDLISARIRKGQMGADVNLAPPIETTVMGLKQSIDPDQRETFQYVFDRWYMLEARSPFDNAIRVLNRAFKDPDLKLDEPTIAKFQSIIKETYAKLPPFPERRAALNDAAQEAAKKILADLSPEQQAIIKAHLAQGIEEAKAVDAYYKEVFARRRGGTEGTGG